MTSTSALTLDLTEELVQAAATSKAWPFEEARKLVKRYAKSGMPKEVLFETGYGPSGLPHIGTFGEVARTSMVRTAFRALTNDEVPTRLLCFSDDMDGFRKVPTNVPQQDMLAQYLELPLTRVPDPFGTHEGFAQHNNARLCAFLDQFGFDYEFASSTDYYTSGRFDETLLRMLEVYDKIMGIILPTLGAERQATYSPFLPVCPRTGKVLQVPMIERNASKGTVVYIDPETNEKVEVPVTGGAVKCQWKADWAMRWAALDVAYEMSGKDLIDSVKLSTKICRALGKPQPESLSYELFLDEKGAKISKSKGNGLTIEEWLTYASPESLSLYMFQKPKTAKKLYFDVIPKAVDEYFTFLSKVEGEEIDKKLVNPTWHIHSGVPPKADMPISFALLLNLVSAANAHDKDVLWGFISRYAPGANAQSHPKLDELAGYAIRYFDDFVKPKKQFHLADEKQSAALADLAVRLKAFGESNDAEALQTEVFSAGKAHEFENLRDWFKTIYQVLLGQDQGPRFGSFIALYGVENTVALIEKGLSGALKADHDAEHGVAQV
ncbi:lysine--tRNA ligase [Cohaesibacter gelatinilyticus]|uniref:Lysine--tRNA ligase n=1 Tax=Cohaesibacter gelatinilyticus TaxID=372072 RepID=A0A285PIX2_9HYPH|nr:lysine--tRNA ligase [Cohaesibacter gelatinilyticus]SNZ21664.1 lysyl-tRNA synthetase, class I [Cohaesibacter gelatinilyticus]